MIRSNIAYGYLLVSTDKSCQYLPWLFLFFFVKLLAIVCKNSIMQWQCESIRRNLNAFFSISSIINYLTWGSVSERDLAEYRGGKKVQFGWHDSISNISWISSEQAWMVAEWWLAVSFHMCAKISSNVTCSDLYHRFYNSLNPSIYWFKEWIIQIPSVLIEHITFHRLMIWSYIVLRLWMITTTPAW